jgi:hypothetical protein
MRWCHLDWKLHWNGSTRPIADFDALREHLRRDFGAVREFSDQQLVAAAREHWFANIARLTPIIAVVDAARAAYAHRAVVTANDGKMVRGGWRRLD